MASDSPGGGDAYVRYQDWLTISWMLFAFGVAVAVAGVGWYWTDFAVTAAESAATGTAIIEFETHGPGWILGPATAAGGLVMAVSAWNIRGYARSIKPRCAEVAA